MFEVAEPEDRGPAGFRQRKTSAASVWWCFILSGLWDTPSPTGTDWSGPGKCWAAQLSCMKNGGPERRTEIAAEEARARVAHVVFQACFGVSNWLRRHQSSERVLTLTCPPAEPRTVGIDRRYGGWKCWTQTLGRSACERARLDKTTVGVFGNGFFHLVYWEAWEDTHQSGEDFINNIQLSSPHH